MKHSIFREAIRIAWIEFPNLVSNVRGRGPFCSFDPPDTGTMNRLRAGVYQPGL